MLKNEDLGYIASHSISGVLILSFVRHLCSFLLRRGERCPGVVYIVVKPLDGLEESFIMIRLLVGFEFSWILGIRDVLVPVEDRPICTDYLSIAPELPVDLVTVGSTIVGNLLFIIVFGVIKFLRTSSCHDLSR